MDNVVSKTKFKAQALEIFRRVEMTGNPVIVTDRGKPTLIVRKYLGPQTDVRSKLKGSVLRYDAPLEPVGEQDWEALA